MKKRYKIFFSIFLSLVILLPILSLSFINSEKGTHVVFNVLTRLTQQRFRVQQVHGSLLHQLDLQNLSWQSSQESMLVQHIVFSWQPWQLLRGHLLILKLTLENVNIDDFQTGQPSSADINFAHWLNFIAVTVNNASFSNISWQSQQNKIQLLHATLQAKWHSHEINILFVWHDLDYQLAKYKGKINGQLFLGGVAKKYHWQGDINATIFLPATKDSPASKQDLAWQLGGTGNNKQISLEKINGSFWPKNLQMNISYDFTNFWQAHLYGQHINPGVINVKWPGDLNLDAELYFQPSQDSTTKPHLDFQLHSLTGVLRQRSIKASGVFHFLGDRLVFENFSLQAATSSLLMQGELSKNSHFTWRIHIADLLDFLPDASGQADSQGLIKKDIQFPDIQLKANIQKLRYQKFLINQLNAVVDFSADMPRQFIWQLKGNDLYLGKVQIQNIALQSKGDWLKHKVDFSLLGTNWQWKMQILGGFNKDNAWYGAIENAKFSGKNFPVWQQIKPATIKVVQNNLQMPDDFCLQNTQQNICSKIELDAHQDATIILKTSWLNLADWQFLMPKDQQILGQIKLYAKLGLSWQYFLSGQAELEASNLRWRNLTETTLPNLIISRANAQLQTDSKGIHSQAKLQSNFGEANAKLDWQTNGKPINEWSDMPWDGRFIWRWDDIALIGPWLLPNLQNIHAKAAADFQIKGSWQNPRIDGKMNLSQGSFRLPDYNINVQDVALELQGNPLEQMKLKGHLRSEGEVQVNGQLLQAITNPVLDLSITGKRFLAANLPSYRVFADPDLRLQYQKNAVDLTGQITIPEATLKPIDYNDSVIELSPDVEYVDSKASTTLFNSTIHLVLGSNVSLKYGGLSGSLAGDVNLTSLANTATTGQGEIVLQNGKYEAYGQSFDIRQGRLIFKGGVVTNPILDVQAVRTLTNVVPVMANGNIPMAAQFVGPDNTLVVGVKVEGPLAQRKILLFSEPVGLSQADILSYLILGRPISQTDSGNGQVLLSAASALNSGSGPINELQKQIKQTFGLDQLDVGGTSQYNPTTQNVTQNTSLILGKALSPRLFLNYSIGIAQPVNTLRLRYMINKSWVAQTESSSLGNGADIFYTIDRD